MQSRAIVPGERMQMFWAPGLRAHIILPDKRAKRCVTEVIISSLVRLSPLLHTRTHTHTHSLFRRKRLLDARTATGSCRVFTVRRDISRVFYCVLKEWRTVYTRRSTTRAGPSRLGKTRILLYYAAPAKRDATITLRRNTIFPPGCSYTFEIPNERTRSHVVGAPRVQ